MNNLKRKLLYNWYYFLKKTGYINLMNKFNANASILMFHRVNDYSIDGLTVSSDVFDDLIQEISKNYKPISLTNLIGLIQNKKRIDSRTVVITFDDGYEDNYNNAAPILLKYNVPATFFITSGFIETNKVFEWDCSSKNQYPLMNWDQVIELSRYGFDIGSHSVNHPNFGMITYEVAKRELIESKEQIENKINKKIHNFAYPFGRIECMRTEYLGIAEKAGYSCCCSGYGGKVTVESNLYNLCRIPMYPTKIEALMELDNLMTVFINSMRINIFGPIGFCFKINNKY